MSAPHTASTWRFAWQRLRRGWASGELRVLVLALAIAAAAAIAVGLFTDRVRLALEAGAGEQLGADAVISGRDPLPEPQMAALRATGVRDRQRHQLSECPLPGSMARTPSWRRSRGVDAGYPLRGKLLLSREPFGATEAAPPAAGTGRGLGRSAAVDDARPEPRAPGCRSAPPRWRSPGSLPRNRAAAAASAIWRRT